MAGKTQTYLPWDSWKHPYTDRERAAWFHEIFRTDGRPYRQEEVDFIRTIIGPNGGHNEQKSTKSGVERQLLSLGSP